MAKILFFSGSIRKESINKKLAILAAKLAKEAGAEVTMIDLKDYDMPLYNGDLEMEQGIPENAKKLKQVFIAHDGFFIASPEYNSAYSALLKNTVDWVSRPHKDNEIPLVAYKGKVAALGATSPGMLGGLRGLISLRMLLGNMGMTVIPSQIAVGAGFKAFDSEGGFVEERDLKNLQATIDELLRTTDKLKSE